MGRLRDDAVTPVVGSILVLAISVLGIAAIMSWGAPTIQSVQDRNGQLAMVGELDGVRLDALALSVPDAARTPTVVIPSGELSVTTGTRFLIAIDQDASNTACDFHVTGWETSGTDSVAITAAGCRTPTLSCDSLLASEACLEIHAVSGGNTVRKTVTAGGLGYQVSGADFSTGAWMFRLTDNATTNPAVYAQAWLLSSAMHQWFLESPVEERAVYQDGTAVFSRTGETYYLESDPPIQEDAFGSGDYVLWLRTFSAINENAHQAGSANVFLGLVGNYARVDTSAYQLRYDFSGTLSEAWCNALSLRNNDISAGAYTVQTACTSAVPSLTYQATGGAVFTFEFLHANIRTQLQ